MSHRSCQKALHAAVAKIVEDARSNGCANPTLYITPDALFVMDKSHPAFEDSERYADLSPAIVARYTFGVPHDIGDLQ